MIDAGIPNPREYRDALIHDFHLDAKHQKFLKQYFLAEAMTRDLFMHIKDGELHIKKKSYSVIWIEPPSKVRDASVALVSLRWCDHLNRGYVLVKILRGDGQFSSLEYV